MSYRVGDTVKISIKLYDATDSPVEGILWASFTDKLLTLNSETDKTALLSFAEVGGGVYVISFTPDAAGHYSLIYTEPAGTLGYHQKQTFEILSATSPDLVSIDVSLYATVVSHIQDSLPVLASGASGDISEACQSAILVFSSYEPRELVYTVTGDDSTKKVYFSSIAEYSEGFSKVVRIEYPSGSTPPDYLDEDEDWWIARDGTGKYIGLYDAVASGSSAFVTYTLVHALDGSTLEDWDKKRVAFLAAGFALEKIAAAWLQESNAALGAAVTDFRSRSDQAAARAKDYMSLFYSFFGGGMKGMTGAAAPVVAKRKRISVQRNDTDFRPRLTHGN